MIAQLEQLKEYAFAGNTGYDYVIFLVIFLVVFMGLKIFRIYVLYRLRKLAEKTKNDIDDLVIDYISGIHTIFYFFISLYLALKYLVLSNFADRVINYMLVIFVAFYAVLAVNMIIDYFTRKEIEKRKEQNKQDTSLVKVLSNIIKSAVWVIAILLIVSNFGVDITSLIAGLGIGGIAIAFALQKILEDIFSSFSIYFDKPFEEGDFIIIGEDMGTVKQIGLKTTRLQHLMGQELVVSNRELTSTRVHNYKKMQKRRIAFSFGVEYGTPLKKLKKVDAIVKKIIDKIDLAELDRVHFKEFGDFSLNYEVVYYLNSRDYNVYMDTQQEINFKLIENFEKEGIEFAFPTQTIHLKK